MQVPNTLCRLRVPTVCVVQATASSSGKVALFDCHQFRRGGVLGPVAYAVLDPSFPGAALLHPELGVLY